MEINDCQTCYGVSETEAVLCVTFLHAAIVEMQCNVAGDTQVCSTLRIPILAMKGGLTR